MCAICEIFGACENNIFDFNYTLNLEANEPHLTSNHRSEEQIAGKKFYRQTQMSYNEIKWKTEKKKSQKCRVYSNRFH